MRIQRKNKGFTLLEILLVIAAIGILAAIVLVAINPTKQIESARSAQRKSEINSITKAIQQYSIDNNGQYPVGIETGAKPICNTDNTPTGCVNLSTTLSPTYIASIPTSDSNRYYVRRSNNNNIEVSHPRDSIWNIGGTPSLDLNFAKNKSLIDGVSGNNLIDFTRAETTPTANRATYVGEDGLIKTAAANEARFDHNPVTGESLGLLVEEQRTNDFTYSEQFDNAVWTKTNSAVTPNNITAPNGLSVGTLISSLASGVVNVNRNFTRASPAFSIYLKSASSSTANVKIQSDVVGRNVSYNVNLTNGTISAGTGNTGNLTGWGEYASITSIGSGWYRIFIGFGSSTTTVNSTYSISPSANGSASGANESIYLWGAQLETGSFPTSYIPTTTAAVTRAADVASITGTKFLSWYNASSGSFLFAHKSPNTPSTSTYFYLITAGIGSTVNGYRITSLVIPADAAGNNAWSTTGAWLTTGLTANESTKLAFGFTNGSAAAVKNGVVQETNTENLAAVVPTTLSLASGVTSTIARLAFWPARLPNTTLQSITQ